MSLSQQVVKKYGDKFLWQGGKKLVSQYDKCLKDYGKYIQKVADNFYFFR